MTSKKPAPGDLEPIEKASRDEVAALQLQRLKWSLRHAYDNVPHYRKKFDDAGVKPEDLKQLSDLAKFPFTTKQDLRDNYPFNMFAVPREKVVRIHASSGTTGKPTVVGYTQKDIDVWSDLMARSIRAAGGRPGDIVHVAYGYGLFTGGLGAHYGAERLGCTVIPMSGGQTEKQVQLILDFKPDIIMVTPSYSLAIADEFERQGHDPAKSSLQIGLFGAEPWTNQMRTEIEKRMGIDAVDIYGLSEVMGPGVASECIETKDGLVIWEDFFYPEVIDPVTGEVRPDGESGELVFTSLAKEALPIIRYRTRDLTRLLRAHRAQLPPHGQDHWTLRRHAHHPRRERLPLADRGDDPQAVEAGTPLCAGSHASRAHGRTGCAGGDEAGVRKIASRRATGGGQGTATPHQVLHRGVDPGARRRPDLHRTFDRQGQASHRQTAQVGYPTSSGGPACQCAALVGFCPT